LNKLERRLSLLHAKIALRNRYGSQGADFWARNHSFHSENWYSSIRTTLEIYRQPAHGDFDFLVSGNTHAAQIGLPGCVPITLIQFCHGIIGTVQAIKYVSVRRAVRGSARAADR
jgi:hypothetical protein